MIYCDIDNQVYSVILKTEGSRNLATQSSVYCSLPRGSLWTGCPLIFISIFYVFIATTKSTAAFT